ncbi:phosphatidylethanolamine N-methyltransferase-like isoform X1 [Haliotis rubra]|uniref:phosphatidylethanolamine N-methyltransferase-like isoform X1 n=2 Tax=Haliotis rubra TaxID=36100 RepID=UPI001EE61BE6|nr:phosphatidylethanolamine N-methyltransferase-like isoform X1 [Haliotis rubra]
MNYHMNQRQTKGCCEDTMLDLSKMAIPDLAITWTDFNVWFGLAALWLTPFTWNVVARLEYRTQFLTKLFGNPRLACTALALCIISATLYKSYRFKMAMDSQPRCILLQENWILWLGYFLIYLGVLLVVSSFLALGFFGTYLGDYFGILMDEKVTSFPFNLVGNPMYVGSTINYLGMALIRASSAGLFLTAAVGLAYYVAILFEEPFTEEIYRNRKKQS